MTKLFAISDLANELGVTQRTIRYYEQQGLILPARAGSHRIYSSRDRARLILILRGKRLGFSLQDIAEYLHLYDADPEHQTQVAALIDKVRARIGDLEEQLEAVQVTMAELREIETLAVAALRREQSDSDE